MIQMDIEFSRLYLFQDVRGKYRSEGDFQVIRPLVLHREGPDDVDESTDNYDTIEWLRKLPHDETLTALSLCMILGGAIGNLIDRVLLGHVIDYIQVWLGSYPFPAFNLADAAISVGAALLILASFLGARSDRQE